MTPARERRMDEHDLYDVLVVGYGPSGMMAAILLGRAGHRVAVVERHRTLYNLPRVGIVHDDVLRMFDEIGIVERVWPATAFLPEYQLANPERILLTTKVATYATHGWPEFTSLYQPAFEFELDRLAQAMPNVDVLQGETVTALAQDADSVTVTTERDTGGVSRLRGRWLIGADGGNSFVRPALGIPYEDLGFHQDWLVIDAKKTRGRPGLPPYQQFCDPDQPGMSLQIGPEHRRWSFMILPEESVDEVVKPESVWRRLDRPVGCKPDEYELIRVVSYTFRSLIAERWRAGRVLLAGDAAHQMPPNLAQGLCTGFRDAHNLAWKLDLVLKDIAGEALLDSYAPERESSTRATVVESMRVAQNVIERDPEKAKRRDAQLIAMQAEIDQGKKPLIAFRVPGYARGCVDEGHPAAGQPFVQGKVRRGGKEGRFDEVVGNGFVIVARRGDPATALSGADAALWSALGGRFAVLGGAGPHGIEDLEGRYGAMLDAYGCDVLLARPDYYLFGGCRSLGDLPRLLDRLRARLGAHAAV
jgi:2-polyprenyl-6-methoxyphenol hydroxylase-like FAD-dependent oxidoreductase